MKDISPDDVKRALELQQRAYQHVCEWQTSDADYRQRNQELLQDLLEIRHWLERADARQRAGQLWDSLFRHAEASFNLDGQELLCALLIEIYPDAAEGLDEMFHAHDPELLHITETVRATLERLDDQYGWTDDFDLSADAQNAHFWYVSENKLEPRFGRRVEDPGADQEMPVAIARDMAAFRDALRRSDPEQSLRVFLQEHPDYRHLARRAQVLGRYPYGEIRDNLIAEGCSPLDILRFKLAFFGAAKFDPKSSLWTRITMFQGAPLMSELDEPWADDWWLSVAPQNA